MEPIVKSPTAFLFLAQVEENRVSRGKVVYKMAAALLGQDKRQEALQRLRYEEHMAGGIQDGCCSPRIGQEAGGLQRLR
jgi:hypothetical protein